MTQQQNEKPNHKPSELCCSDLAARSLAPVGQEKEAKLHLNSCRTEWSTSCFTPTNVLIHYLLHVQIYPVKGNLIESLTHIYTCNIWLDIWHMTLGELLVRVQCEGNTVHLTSSSHKDISHQLLPAADVTLN